MKRMTFIVDESTARRLDFVARRTQRSRSAVVRDALGKYLARRSQLDTLPAFVAFCASGSSDGAERHEEVLTDEWG